MGKATFSIDDITESLLRYIDKYLKTVIINAKKRFYRKQGRSQKHGIVFVELDKYEENLHYDEPGYERVLYQIIEVQGIKFPVYNQELADALRGLTETQRLVLLKNVVLHIPMKQLAQDLGISKRMVEKHKYNAIQAIKRRMLFYDE